MTGDSSTVGLGKGCRPLAQKPIANACLRLTYFEVDVASGNADTPH